MNETHPSSCFNPTAERIGLTFVYGLLFAVSLAGNTFIAIIVYKTKTMRKPTNFFIVNMAVFDLLFTILVFPVVVTKLHITSWLPSGPLGLAFCKLNNFLTFVSATVSIQSLVLIAVDRFGAVLFPLRSPLISSKHCPFFILATWIIAMAFHCPTLFAWKFIEHRGELECRWERSEVTTSSRNYQLASTIVLFCVHYHLCYNSLKTQVPEYSRRAISQRRTTTCDHGAKCTQDVHCYRVSVCSMLASLDCPRYTTVIITGQHHDFVLRLRILHAHRSNSGLLLLRYKPLYLLYFQWKLSSRS